MSSPLTASSSSPTFKQLKVAIVGGGIGGLAAAVSLRRAGHIVEVFERRDFDVEVGASISCAANGTQWLREWEANIPMMKPINLQKLVMRDWETGHILNQYDQGDYEATWGHPSLMFYRQDMHRGLFHTATSEEGKGVPCKVVVDHICESVDYETGTIKFKNGRTVTADLIVGADGIRSVIRQQIGITPNMRAAPQTCYRCNVLTKDVKRLGLVDYSYEPAIQYWGGMVTKSGRSKFYKIVMTPCSGGDIVSFYCFMPSELTNHHEEGFEFKEVPVDEVLQGNYGELDPNCADLLRNSYDRMPWRLYVHQPYEYWHKGKTCLLGDAAHPMMPHQSQGACMAIEDAAALGIIFSDKYGFTNDVEAGVALYEKIRKGRATRVQQSSARATENLNERIGFSTLTPHDASLAAADGKLTVNEMNMYKMHDHVATEVGVGRAS